jgi:hypothetical protein
MDGGAERLSNREGGLISMADQPKQAPLGCPQKEARSSLSIGGQRDDGAKRT